MSVPGPYIGAGTERAARIVRIGRKDTIAAVEEGGHDEERYIALSARITAATQVLATGVREASKQRPVLTHTPRRRRTACGLFRPTTGATRLRLTGARAPVAPNQRRGDNNPAYPERRKALAVERSSTDVLHRGAAWRDSSPERDQSARMGGPTAAAHAPPVPSLPRRAAGRCSLARAFVGSRPCDDFDIDRRADIESGDGSTRKHP